MSAAGAWAVRLANATAAAAEIERERPKDCPAFYTNETKWVGFRVDDRGRPVMCMADVEGTFDLANTERLLAQCRWLLATFGESSAEWTGPLASAPEAAT